MHKRPATQKRKKAAHQENKTARHSIFAKRRGIESAPDDVQHSPLQPRRRTEAEKAAARAARNAMWIASQPNEEVAAEMAAKKAAQRAAWEAARIARAQAECATGSSSTAAAASQAAEVAEMDADKWVALLGTPAGRVALLGTPAARAARLAEGARATLARCEELASRPGWQGEAWIKQVDKAAAMVALYEEQERVALYEEQEMEGLDSMINSIRLSPTPKHEIEDLGSMIKNIRLSQDLKMFAGYKKKTSKKSRNHRISRKKHRKRRTRRTRRY